MALSDGVCLHLAVMPDRPLRRAAQLHVRAVSAANVDVHHSLTPVLPAPPFCLNAWYANGLAPTFEVAWLSPNPDALIREHNSPGALGVGSRLQALLRCCLLAESSSRSPLQQPLPLSFCCASCSGCMPLKIPS